MSSGIAIGITTAVLSALFNGSFAALSKIPGVAKHKLDPILFMCYFTLGFFILSWLTVPFFPLVYNSSLNNMTNNSLAGGPVYVWSSWGILAGLFQDLALTFSFFAIPRVGLSIAQGVWGGISIIFSIIMGIAVLGNKVTSVVGLVFALIILLVSIGGIAFCNELGTKFIGLNTKNAVAGKNNTATTEAFVEENNEAGTSVNKVTLPSGEMTEDSSADKKAPRDFVVGLISAALVGIFGGSILVPLGFAAPPAGGIVFVPSQGVGAMIFAPLIAVVYFVSRRQKPNFHAAGTLLPGVAAGFIWGLGDICSVIAIPFISYAVAYPILQCALLISGLWGVLVFKEVDLCAAKIIFFISGVVLIGGAFLLAKSVAA